MPFLFGTHVPPSPADGGSPAAELLLGLSQPLGGMGEWQMHLIRHIANAGERALTRVLKSGQKDTAVMSQLDFQRKRNICVYQLRNEHMRTHTHKAYLPPHTLSSRKGTYISLYT